MYTKSAAENRWDRGGMHSALLSLHTLFCRLPISTNAIGWIDLCCWSDRQYMFHRLAKVDDYDDDDDDGDVVYDDAKSFHSKSRYTV